MHKTPDMRVFNASVANDHGVYDACLVRTFQKYSTWTHADFTAVPVAAEHFLEHTRDRVAATLRKELLLPSTFGSGKKSFVPTDLAFLMVQELGARHHVQRDPLDIPLNEISAALRMSAKSNTLVIHTDDHPLASDYRARNVAVADQTAGGDMQQRWMKELELQRDELDVVKKLAALKREELTSLLGNIQPFLLDIDDTYVRSPLANLRHELLASLGSHEQLDGKVRRELFEKIHRHWQDSFDADAFEAANADLIAETGDPKILEATIDVMLQKGFIEPLERDDEKSDDRKQQLLHRKIVLEAIFLSIVDTKQWELLPLLVQAHDAYIDRLKLKLGELGYLALINVVMTSKIDSIEKLTAALH